MIINCLGCQQEVDAEKLRGQMKNGKFYPEKAYCPNCNGWRELDGKEAKI